MKLWVNIAFHYKEHRLPYLNKVIDSILQIPSEETRIIVNSNEAFECKVPVHQILGMTNNWDLTWAHKLYLNDFLKSDFTHFVYTEDDHVLTPELMDYWITNRELMKSKGFLPGMHRVEYNNNNVYSVDCTHKQQFKEVVIDGKRFASLQQPYQGLMVMDRELVEQHVKSKSYTYTTCSYRFGYAESANSEYIYDDVPPGFVHRLLVPIDNFSECWIHHCANNYCTQPGTAHGKLPIGEVLWQ
jgi:hypothetical protein